MKFKKDQNFENADLLCLEMFKKNVLTEKSVDREIKNNCVTFLVHNHITKTHIKLAFKSFFGVEVIKVGVINTKGHLAKFQGRPFQTKGAKKVMITVDDINKVREVLNG